MNRLNTVTKECVMKIYVKKTKVMCISRKAKSKVHLLVDDQQVEQVSQFKYLGSWISDDGYATKDIRARTAKVKTLFMDKKKLLSGKLNCEQKSKL